MTSASGFTWVAREPKLMVGAEGARILTEINRLPQFAPISTTQNRGKAKALSAYFAAGPGSVTCSWELDAPNAARTQESTLPVWSLTA